MRILINDHAGHPFQIQLSRALAERGHVVRHCFTKDLKTPRGDLVARPEERNLEIEPIELGSAFERYGYLRRLQQERLLGSNLAECVRRFTPAAVVSANTPLLAQRALQRACHGVGGKFVFWLQDILSIGIGQALAKKHPLLGKAAGATFGYLENSILRRSDAIVAISEDFTQVLLRRGIRAERISVVHNWAPLDALPSRAKDNDWSREHELHGASVVMYTGTLGLKHNPQMLVELARALRSRPDARLVVISEGTGADYLAEARGRENLESLVLLPYQPFDRLPDVLGSADVLLAVLEKHAGQFAVPSKVLTYLCAGRAIVAAMPAENLAARTILQAGAGVVVDPDDSAGFVTAVERLIDDPHRRQAQSERARTFAERQFDIDIIADKFEAILEP
ncbi:MAG: glycosyltransferase family 4 protein [Pseudomonadota bacterium]